MKEVNARIALIRSTLNLSMEKFGNKIGITRSSVNSLEKGVNNPSEQTLKLICSQFNVNYLWLTEGIGDIFNEFPQTILDELVEEFNLDETDRMILEVYLEAPEDQRKALSNFFQTFAKKAQKMRED